MMTEEINEIILEELEKELLKRDIGHDNLNDTAKDSIINKVKSNLKEEEADNSLFDGLDIDMDNLFGDIELEPFEDMELEPFGNLGLEPFEDLGLEPLEVDIKPLVNPKDNERPIRERIREKIIKELNTVIAEDKPS